jgi:alkanesulfonate monooxygenase SsuD/methylene tetrahydromethanopterin reductase-like flavin-dependent oxidoreductase (luciferase family)
VQAPHPPVWITGIGNPKTMEFCLKRDFGFNYFGWFGAKETAPRILDRFGAVANSLGKPFNPFQIGFMQMIAVGETDAEAEDLYAEHIEFFFRKALGSIPPHRLMLPGGIDIRGVEALIRDPSDFGMYSRMRTATFRELVEAGCAICGSAQTVRDQLVELVTKLGIGNLHAMLQFGSMPNNLARHNTETFARKVLPDLTPIFEKDADHHWWPERLGGKPKALSASERGFA